MGNVLIITEERLSVYILEKTSNLISNRQNGSVSTVIISGWRTKPVFRLEAIVRCALCLNGENEWWVEGKGWGGVHYLDPLWAVMIMEVPRGVSYHWWQMRRVGLTCLEMLLWKLLSTFQTETQKKGLDSSHEQRECVMLQLPKFSPFLLLVFLSSCWPRKLSDPPPPRGGAQGE